MTGDYKGSFKNLSDSINAVIERFHGVKMVYVQMAAGDMSYLENLERNGSRSEKDMLTPSCVKMMKSIISLTDEASRLAQAAAEGNLNERGDAGSYEGVYAR